jgi:hypothetical protein
MIRSEWHEGPEPATPEGPTPPLSLSKPTHNRLLTTLGLNHKGTIEGGENHKASRTWRYARTSLPGIAAPSHLQVPLLLPLTYWDYKLSQEPCGRTQVIRSKWQSPPEVSIQRVGRELSVGVEAGVSLLIVPQRVRYHFDCPRSRYFLSSDSWVTKSQVISLSALRFLYRGLSSFYLSWLLCSSVG